MNNITIVGLIFVTSLVGIYLAEKWIKSYQATPLEPIQYELIIDPNQKEYNDFDVLMSGYWT